MAKDPTIFPGAEGLGIFFGVVGWDILTEGQPEMLKALLIAAAGAILLFSLRYWKARQQRDR